MKTTGIEITIEFSENCPPDFEMMKENGWTYPPGLGEGEYLTNSLVKVIDSCEIHLVRHPFAPRGRDIYLVTFHGEPHEMSKVRRRGTGQEFEIEEMMEVIKKFSEEMAEIHEEVDF